MKKAIEWFILGGNGFLILLGFLWNVWEPVVLGAANVLIFFGLPMLGDWIRDAARRRK